MACAVSLVVATTARAAEGEPQRFRPLPPDESVQPLVTPPEKGTSRVRYVGVRSFKEEQIRVALAEQLREIEAKDLSPARADDTAYFLEVFYRKSGYSQVDVRWRIEGPALVLDVTEGPLTQLGQIVFRGNKNVDDNTLAEYMVGSTRERFIAAKKTFPFIEADIAAGVDRLRGFYVAEGYANAAIGDPVVELTRDKTRANVLINIVEGTKYRFAPEAVRFSGNVLFTREAMLTGLGESLAKPYTQAQVMTMQRNLQYFYKSRGYFAAKVEGDGDLTRARRDGVVPVAFTVVPGALHRFDGVRVHNEHPEFSRLRPGFLEKRFGKLSGQIYDPVKLDDTFRELMRTGLFKNLRLDSKALPTNEVELSLAFEEAKAKELGFSVGYGTFEGGILGLHAGDRNIFGSGRPLTSSIEISQRSLRGEILYIDPWWFESAYALRLRLYATSRDVPGYAKLESGLRVEVARKLSRQIELSAFLLGKKVEITEAVIEPPELLGSTSYFLTSIGFTQNYDFRDNPINPSRGFVANNTLDFNALAGDLTFGRATVRLSYYLPIRQKSMLAFGARGGLIYPVAESVPIDERFFNGGSTTVRSFAERELGPKDQGEYPIGGEAFTVFNLEYDFPLWKALHGAVFADAGNLEGQLKDAGVENMRYALGVGLRYKLPIGPVRADYGINPSPGEEEAFGAFHFSFGFAF